MLSECRVLSPSTVNDFAFGFNQLSTRTCRRALRQQRDRRTRSLPPRSPESDHLGVPAIGITGYTGSPAIANVAQSHTSTKCFQCIDNLSMSRGKHSIRFGGEIRRDRYINQIGNQLFPRGSFTFGTAPRTGPRTTTAVKCMAD